jgi:hypothetical protein
MDRQHPDGKSSASRVPRSRESIFLRSVWSSREPWRTGLAVSSLSGEQYFAQPPQLLLVWKDDSRDEETICGSIKDDKAGLKTSSSHKSLPVSMFRTLATKARKTFISRRRDHDCRKSALFLNIEHTSGLQPLCKSDWG